MNTRHQQTDVRESNTGAKEIQQLNPGGPDKSQRFGYGKPYVCKGLKNSEDKVLTGEWADTAIRGGIIHHYLISIMIIYLNKSIA